ncbi:fascin domain-containing protein [Cyclobacterium plantarum]|uniref:fascin domain-containing protein n=1 Tax=Cyclobacterium plantarum TaxID=2716263 RepID=UPI003F712209
MNSPQNADARLIFNKRFQWKLAAADAGTAQQQAFPLQLEESAGPEENQKFKLEIVDQTGSFALKTAGNFYVGVSSNSRPGEIGRVGKLTEDVTLVEDPGETHISIHFLERNVICLRSKDGRYITVTNSGGMPAPAGAEKWTFTTDAREIGENNIFRFLIPVHERRRRSYMLNTDGVKQTHDLLQPLLSSSIVRELGATMAGKNFINAKNAQLLTEIVNRPEIKALKDERNPVYPRPVPAQGSNRRTRSEEIPPPTSISLNFGGGGGLILAGSFVQSITFDLNENKPNAGVAIYTGSSSLGASVGMDLGGSSGASVSINWFEAKDAGGWFWGGELDVVGIVGINVSFVFTFSGPSFTVGVAGGYDLGLSISGGYTFLEGSGLYSLSGVPTISAPVDRRKAVRILNNSQKATYLSHQEETIFQIGVPYPTGLWGSFYVFKFAETGTVPVYEYIMDTRDIHGQTVPIYYYSTSKTTPQNFKTPDKPKFYVFPNEIPGKTRPIHLFTKRLGNGLLLYWYTPISFPNRDGDMPPGFEYNHVAFHAYI